MPNENDSNGGWLRQALSQNRLSPYEMYKISQRNAAAIKQDEGITGNRWIDNFFGGIGTIILMVVYMIAFQPIGFVVSSAVYLFIQMLVFSNRDNRKIILFAVIAVLLPLAVDALFVYVIHMPLPVGVFGFEG